MIIKVSNKTLINLDQVKKVEVYTQATAEEGHVFALDFDSLRVWMKDYAFAEMAFGRIWKFVEDGRKVADISDCVRKSKVEDWGMKR